jgi:hypothetical protein
MNLPMAPIATGDDQPPRLYALTVEPFAPNFSALRRVSSNFERM